MPSALDPYDDDLPLPDPVMAYVWVASERALITASPPPESSKPFRSSKADKDTARKAVEQAGLQVVAESRLGLAVAGPAAAYEELTGGKIRRYARQMHAEAGRRRDVTHLDIEGDDHPKTFGVGFAPSDAIHAVVLEQPRLALAEFPSPFPPPVARHHLRVPDDVAVALGAVEAHRDGHTGEGVTVAMVDTGHYAHPYFRRHAYDIREAEAVVPGTDPRLDPVGHGTGESANILAIAPGARLRPYRASDEGGRLVGAVAAFMRAKADRPDIITNSWGGDGPFPPKLSLEPYERAFVAEILDAVERGIVVVFSAGNGDFSIEPQVPRVLSAGGVFRDADGVCAASDYASSYTNRYYAKQPSVPDLCGLVGERPRAQYLMLPVPPACQIDVEQSQERPKDPPDGTAPDDGWALFSGTSAAAPQVAGAVAVMLEARAKEKPGKTELTPEQVKEALVKSATDIDRGHTHPRFNAYAREGADVATGAGLLNVSAAVKRALRL